MPEQRLMTRAEFERFIDAAQTKLYVRAPYTTVPCSCGDVNCHGWRFIELPHGWRFSPVADA